MGFNSAFKGLILLSGVNTHFLYLRLSQLTHKNVITESLHFSFSSFLSPVFYFGRSRFYWSRDQWLHQFIGSFFRGRYMSPPTPPMAALALSVSRLSTAASSSSYQNVQPHITYPHGDNTSSTTSIFRTMRPAYHEPTRYWRWNLTSTVTTYALKIPQYHMQPGQNMPPNYFPDLLKCLLIVNIAKKYVWAT